MEGAIPLETIFSFMEREEIDPSLTSVDDLEKRFRYTDFEHFIETWIWKNTCITEEKDFEIIAYEVLKELNHQNVKYVEAFYSPGDFENQGLSVPGITECMLKGINRAHTDFGIGCQLIMDIVRGDGIDTGLQRLEEVTPYLGKGILGIGLGGNEQKFPAEDYAPVYEEARKRGFRLTAHAGEAAGADSIWAAIRKLHAERIGHGTRAYEDPFLVSYLRNSRIPLEMCVVSNLKTGICTSYEDHPIARYYSQGLLVTVNSDDPTMFNTSINEEYAVLARHLGFSLHDLKSLSINGVRASFLSDEEKATLIETFNREWEQIFITYGDDYGSSSTHNP
ncbi:MAG: adenosine deaminase [Theionarchaea archaeon]|nr:adenosine deaminase [Theionarchaea archaeon]